MAFRRSSILLLFACSPYLPMAHGTERVGDATYAYELEQYASAVTGLEKDLLPLIEAASGEGRFNLYWTYNQMLGAWLQVDFLQLQLDLAIAAESDSDEGEIRTTLRDQARFVLWELDHAIAQFTQSTRADDQPDQRWVNAVLRSLLSEVRMTVNRLLVEQCLRARCAPES